MTISLGRHCCACNRICHHVGPAQFCHMHEHLARSGLLPVAPYEPGPDRPERAGIGGMPCPSTVQAVLGFPRETTIPCGLLKGHKGRHVFSIEWSDE
jgi:hypothetical protein